MGESPAGSSPCELGVQMPRTCRADRKGAGRTTGETRRVTRDTAPPHPRNCVTPASRRIRAVVFRVTQTAASPGFARVRITYALICLLLLFHAVLSERFSLALPSPSYLQIPRAHELVNVPLMDTPRFHDHSNPVVPTCLASASSPGPHPLPHPGSHPQSPGLRSRSHRGGCPWCTACLLYQRQRLSGTQQTRGGVGGEGMKGLGLESELSHPSAQEMPLGLYLGGA